MLINKYKIAKKYLISIKTCNKKGFSLEKSLTLCLYIESWFRCLYLNWSGMRFICEWMLVGGLEMPSDQSDKLECGDELDHWSGDPGEGVRNGWSGTWSWWLGVLSIGAE